MLHNRFAGEKLKYLKKLYDGRVEMNGQIVCCKNVNDGPELERSIRDLSQYLPFLRSVSAAFLEHETNKGAEWYEYQTD